MHDRARKPGPRTGLLGRADECNLLAGLLEDVRAGRSRSLLVRGEPGIGKTALLEHLIAASPDLVLARAMGVESEMELDYAGLQQVCAPMLAQLERLPAPQRQALEVVFGLSAGPAPDRLLVGLGVVNLFSEVAEERPLLCVVDDAQWLDRASAQILGFVARRLLAEPIGMVFATREPGVELANLPELEVRGVRDGDARALLTSAVPVKLDERLRDRIVEETRGNPLALLELPHGLSAEELAGFATGVASASPDAVEASFGRRISGLPAATQQLLLIAAAEPLGDPVLVWRAAELVGVSVEAAAPAVEGGLCEFGARVRFRHPLVRAAAYHARSPDERRWAHDSIARATDGEADPDRRAWHRALAAAGPDEAVAEELERSAVRARARGGQAAAAAFLARSMSLTSDPARRAARAVAAAEASQLAGAADDALQLAALASAGPLDEIHRVRIDVLRGRVAAIQRRATDVPPLLLEAAWRLEPFDRRLARETYRDAFIAGIYAGRCAGDIGLREVAAAIRSAAPSSEPPTASDALLDAAALLIDAGWKVGAPAVQRALVPFQAASAPTLEPHWHWLAGRVACWVWDDQSWDALGRRTIEMVRDDGALSLVPFAAADRVGWELFAGELGAAAAHVVEQDTIHEAIGGARSPGSRLALAAFRGREAEVAELDRVTTRDAFARGDGPWVTLVHWSTAVLCNGLGRYERALAAAQQGAAFPADMQMSSWALSELVEAAARCGQPEAAVDALGRLAEMASACGTHWVVGIEARARALAAESGDADELYRNAIEQLQHTPLRGELARARLLYGEWLRREARRVDARAQLAAAYEAFTAFGMEGFAERCRRELLATGERVRRRGDETRDDLTAQEQQIAALARDGLSNPEIGARLFLSPRTVEWHMHKVFAKLDIQSRRELRSVLPSQSQRS